MERNEARAIFGSVIPAMVTPFAEDGSIDFDAAARLADHLVGQGCDGILLSGTTGESPTTHTPEKNELIRVVKEAVGDRARIMAGAGSNDTKHAVRIGEQAVESGADSLLVVSPYYNKPSQEGIAAHILAVADAGGVPVMVYDIPGRTGVKIGPECSEQIAEHPQIVAFKEATGDVVGGIARGRATGTAVYSGDDALNLGFLTHGGAGVVSVVAHVAADRYRAMVDALDAGDLARAAEIHHEVLPLVDAVMGEGLGAVMAKTAVALQGHLPAASFRLPLTAATSAQVARLRSAMEALNYL